jgi:hypothetical protein
MCWLLLECPGNPSDCVTEVVFDIMSPHLNDGPSVPLEQGRYFSPSPAVVVHFLRPKLGVRSGSDIAFWASMPKTPVHKHRHFLLLGTEIGVARHAPQLNPEANASIPEGTTQS